MTNKSPQYLSSENQRMKIRKRKGNKKQDKLSFLGPLGMEEEEEDSDLNFWILLPARRKLIRRYCTSRSNRHCGREEQRNR